MTNCISLQRHRDRQHAALRRAGDGKRTFGLLFSALGTLLLAGGLTGLVGCSSFFIGDENLAEPVDLTIEADAPSVTFSRQWSRRIGDGTDEKHLALKPLVIGQRVFAVSSDGKLTALDADSGTQRWEIKTGHPIAAGVGGDSEVVVVGSNNGLLMAYAAADGKPLWQYQLSTEIMAVPTAVGDLVIARAIDGQVTALSADSGAVAWKRDIGVANLSIRGNANALVIDNVLLLTNSKGRLTLLSLIDGKPVLDAPIVRGRGITTVERIADLLATPTVRHGVLFVSAYRHETLAINLRDGGLLWRSKVATSRDLFADNRFLYIADKNSVISALDLRSGKTVWQSEAVKGHRVSPLAGDGRQLLTVNSEGELLVLDTQDGQLLGRQRVGDERTYVAPTWLGGQWLTYTGDGSLTLTAVAK